MTATITRLRSTLALQMALDSKRRAARMVELREQAHLTQAALAEKSKVSLRTIQRAENPADPIELRHSTIERLAKAYKIKPEAITIPASAEYDTQTNGDTPDLGAALNGNQPQQLDRIEANQTDLKLAIAALESTVSTLAGRITLLEKELREQRTSKRSRGTRSKSA